MSKTGGLGDNLYVGTFDISGDIMAIDTIRGGPALLDFTDITESAFERLGGLRDGELSVTSFFNAAPNRAHAVYSPLPTADEIMSYWRGQVVGNASAVCVAKQINYDGKRGNDGSLSFGVQGLSNAFGVEWGVQLTAGKRVDTTATNGTAVDFVLPISTAFGWQAYLQAFAFTGTSVTIQLQDSADNISFANLGAGGAFTAVTGPTTQRLVSPGATDTVRRYVRVITSGTFSSATFAVVFVRNISAVAF